MTVKEFLIQHVPEEMLNRLLELNVRLRHEGLDTNEFREYGELTRRFTNKLLTVTDVEVVAGLSDHERGALSKLRLITNLLSMAHKELAEENPNRTFVIHVGEVLKRYGKEE